MSVPNPEPPDFEEEISTVKQLIEKSFKKRAKKYGQQIYEAELHKLKEENNKKLQEFSETELEKLKNEKGTFRQHCLEKLDVTKSEIKKKMEDELEKFKCQITAELEQKKEELLKNKEEIMRDIDLKYHNDLKLFEKRRQQEFNTVIEKLYNADRNHVPEENESWNGENYHDSFPVISKEQASSLVIQEPLEAEDPEESLSDSAETEFLQDSDNDPDFVPPGIVKGTNGNGSSMVGHPSVTSIRNGDPPTIKIKRVKRFRRPPDRFSNNFEILSKMPKSMPEKTTDSMTVMRLRGRPRKQLTLPESDDELLSV